MCFYYDETPEFASSSYVVTRKPHRCEACSGAIAVRELAKYSSGLFDGHFYSSYLCNVCAQLELLIVRSELEEGCGWHEAWPPWDELINHANEIKMIWYDEDVNAWKGKPEPGADLHQLKASLDEFQKSLVSNFIGVNRNG